MHRRTASWIFVLASAFAAAAPAAADVLIAPTRLVLEKGERHGEFVLVNKGASSERYRVSLVERRMSPEGRIVEAPETLPGERPASGLIRFSPRTVVLPPDEPQTIRILARRPEDLAPGEYRSHLLIQQVPDAPPAAPAAEAGRARGIQVHILPIYGITVPIIVRHGRLQARGELRNLELQVEGGVPRLHLWIHRAGSRSLYGDLEIRHEQPGGESRVVGRARGISVYTPNENRPFAVELDFPGGQIPPSGRLAAEYRDAEEGASSLIAEAAVALAGD